MMNLIKSAGLKSIDQLVNYSIARVGERAKAKVKAPRQRQPLERACREIKDCD